MRKFYEFVNNQNDALGPVKHQIIQVLQNAQIPDLNVKLNFMNQLLQAIPELNGLYKQEYAKLQQGQSQQQSNNQSNNNPQVQNR
jgi:uncharacterized spore protein YtfJ